MARLPQEGKDIHLSDIMDGDGQNYSVFNSRMLVDTVGDITDEALKASRIKDVIGVLVGRVFNWSQRKSLFPLHLGIECCALEMAAAGASRLGGAQA